MKMYKTVGQLVKEGIIKEGTDLRGFGFKVVNGRVKEATLCKQALPLTGVLFYSRTLLKSKIVKLCNTKTLKTAILQLL